MAGVEVETRCLIVLGLQDDLGVVQTNPPDVLGELAVGSHQFLRGAQPTVRRVNLFDVITRHLKTYYGGGMICGT
jgi:hypothetical protein